MGVDGIMSTLYHRIFLINPRMKKYGVGYAKGRGHKVSVVGYKDDLRNIDSPPVSYPAPGQIDVPIQFAERGESPDPIPFDNRNDKEDKDDRAGYPITATFYNYPTIGNARAILLDTKKLEEMGEKLKKTKPDLKEESQEWWDIVKKYAEVECWFSSPEQPANRSIPGNYHSIVLIPKDQLNYTKQYTVLMGATIKGDPFHKEERDWQETWSFKTVSEKDAKEK